jgi:hypothetical protein
MHVTGNLDVFLNLLGVVNQCIAGIGLRAQWKMFHAEPAEAAEIFFSAATAGSA